MPNLKLVYFPVRAKAEMIRMALAYGNIAYEEVSPATFYGKSWGEGAKAEAPFGQLPVLVVDGFQLAQSGAIMRYVAGLAGLVPADPLAAAKCDAVFEASQDMAGSNPIVNVFKGEQFEEKKRSYVATFPGLLQNLARQLGSGPFFFGTTPYYCDLAVYHILSNARLLEPTCLDQHSSMTKFMKAVETLPGVEKYLSQRPDCVDIGTAPMLNLKA